jgi:hypothetical protein
MEDLQKMYFVLYPSSLNEQSISKDIFPYDDLILKDTYTS